jgi:hypothetical protein
MLSYFPSLGQHRRAPPPEDGASELSLVGWPRNGLTITFLLVWVLPLVDGQGLEFFSKTILTSLDTLACWTASHESS